MRVFPVATAGALLLLVLLPQMGALTANTPDNLTASYNGTTRTVSLSWTPHNSGHGFTYLVWRDGSTPVANTTSLTFAEMPSMTVPDPGLVYLVSSQSPSGAISVPAVVGVATIQCEVVTASTSWQYPYLYVHLHQECLGITYNKDVTWTSPQ